jgi:hypothetical protein
VRVIGINPTEHIEYLEELKKLELKRSHPLSLNDDKFPLDKTSFIFEPGTYIGIDHKTFDILFEVRIRQVFTSNSLILSQRY